MDNSSTIRSSKVSRLLTILSRLIAISARIGLEKLSKTFLLLAIRFYQRYLSPYKGFDCAYRVLHQEQSCSSYFQTCVERENLSRALTSLQKRLLDCHQAHIILQTNASNRRRQQNKKQRQRNSGCLENNNCIGCGDLTDSSLLFLACDAVDCGDCIGFGGCDF